LDDLFTRFQLAADTLSNFEDYLGPFLGAPENVTTTYVGVASTSGDDEVNNAGEKPTETPGRLSVSGTFNYVSMHDTGKAWIGAGAKINIAPSYRTPNIAFDSRNLLEAPALAATLAAHADTPSEYVWGRF